MIRSKPTILTLSLKLSELHQRIYVDSELSANPASELGYTIYVNPLMVVRPGGHYTKHYFAGSERVASKIGNPEDYQDAEPHTQGLLNDNRDPSEVRMALEEIIKQNYDDIDCNNLDGREEDLSNPYSIIRNTDDPSLHLYNNGSADLENLQGYFTRDHLGSSSYVSDISGSAIQFIDYMAFGESFIDRSKTSFATPYRFTGQEQDCETGLYYYGARYYDAKIGRFLSVDPLTKKFAYYTPYQFAGNKPIRFIDLDGLEEYDSMGELPSLAEFFVSTTRDIGDGLYNTAIWINEGFRSSDNNSAGIRYLLINKYGQNYHDVWSISNEKLLDNLEIKYTFFDNKDKGYYLDGKGGFLEEGLEALSNGLNILSAFGMKGSGMFVAKTPGKIANDAANVIDDLNKSFKGVFESVQKHGSKKVGNAGKEPDLAQLSLDKSIQVSTNSTRRVSANYDTGEFSVFDEHLPNIFHGHTRTWSELTQKMQSVLRANGKVTSKGKIINPNPNPE